MNKLPLFPKANFIAVEAELESECGRGGGGQMFPFRRDCGGRSLAHEIPEQLVVFLQNI